MDSVDPRFPPELEKLIFETAARSHPSSALNLMLTSHRTYIWVTAAVYETVDLLSNRPIQHLQNRHANLPYLGKFVKNLAIGGLHECDVISDFLQHCPNLVDLALWSPHSPKVFLPQLQGLKLQRLSAKLLGLNREDLQSIAFSHLTHLDVTSFGKDDAKTWGDLVVLPNLTHLAMNELVPGEGICKLLEKCQRLQILLVVGNDKHGWKFGTKELDDPRFVLMRMSRFMVDEWETGARGGVDFWKVAEQISAAKQRGYFRDEPNTFIWRDSWDPRLFQLGHTNRT